MTFASLLKYEAYPMAAILSELLEFGRAGMGCEVEIEFAVNLAENFEDSVFYFLQMRPMVTGGESVDVEIEVEAFGACLCYSTECLGHGRFDEFADIVFVRPDDFDPAKTREIAAEISKINRELEAESRRYVLIGPGRWGSADRWLGIPVQWRDISGVGAMVEIRNGQLRAEPSQGSHFFQNITSLGIPYMTVTENAGGACTVPEEGEEWSDCMDWRWLLAQKPCDHGMFVSHIRLDRPLAIKCNGRQSEGIILHAEELN